MEPDRAVLCGRKHGSCPYYPSLLLFREGLLSLVFGNRLFTLIECKMQETSVVFPVRQNPTFCIVLERAFYYSQARHRDIISSELY